MQNRSLWYIISHRDLFRGDAGGRLRRSVRRLRRRSVSPRQIKGADRILIADLLEKTDNIKRSAYVWNAVNAMLSALQCPVVLMFVTRLGGMNDAGVFSIAFAVASLMLYIGLYGLRRFQASDVNEEFRFADYNGMRFITCGAMMLASFGYSAYGAWHGGYSFEKAAVIFLVCVLKLVQAYTDVIHGNMQQKGRLDVATKCSAVRYVLEVAVIIVTLFITGDLLASCAASAAVSFIVMMLTTVSAGRKYCSTYVPRFSPDSIKALAVDGFPLFASLFLNMYISNAPKYAIDAYLTDEIQAVYNLIFMPAFMVMLLSNFIFNPIIKSYAELWLSDSEEKHRELLRSFRMQLALVLGLTLLGLAVAATIGIPVLSLIFGTDLSGYRTELCIVMAGGGALAYAQYFSTVITIIREQKSMIICYGIAAAAAYALSGVLVRSYGITGAAVMYAVIMTVLAVLLGIITVWKFAKELKK